MVACPSRLRSACERTDWACPARSRRSFRGRGPCGPGCGRGASLSFALRSGGVELEIGEPLVIASSPHWITASYVLCGLLAWWRRPDSRFGPLMIAAGSPNFASTLSWTTNDVLFTIGQALDLLPPVLFLHVFLAYPSGRLRSPFERALVAAGYVDGDRPRARPDGVRWLRAAQPARGRRSSPDAGDMVLRVQLVLGERSSAWPASACSRLRRRRSGPAAAPLARAADRLVRARRS